MTTHLQNDARNSGVQTWNLLRARIVKHASVPVPKDPTASALEHLVLQGERFEPDRMESDRKGRR